jgi:hypothetical protein
MAGKERLIGRDHMFPGRKRGLDALERRPAISADQLDKDIGHRIGGKDSRIVKPSQAF